MARPASSIILVGPMGAGKSTIGRLLSEALKMPFLDLDREIERRAGATIPWIFDIEGESGFRDREQATLTEVLASESMVLATGGGCILREDNRRELRLGGSVVYLATSVDQQLQRTAKDKNRPLLQTSDPKATLLAMAEQRNPLYDQVSDLRVDTNGKSPRQVVQEILRFSLQE